MKKKVYIIWIGWIWVSAIARYYLHLWYEVFWSDQTNSELIEKLREEGCKIEIPLSKSFPKKEKNFFEKVIYTEAIPKNHPELQKAKELWIKIQTYPEALAEIANNKKLIAIAWTHWKSTTSSLTAITLKDSEVWTNAVIWTILKEFNTKNAHFSDSEYFVIEACEYKRSFLRYKPLIWAITNIDLDHLDYYKDLDDYISAFDEFINNIRTWGFAILNWNCNNSKKLIWKRKDINYIEIFDKYAVFTPLSNSLLKEKEQEQKNNKNTPHEVEVSWGSWSEIITFPEIDMKIPWEHILFDSHIAYIIAHMIWINDSDIINSLENYSGVWRRMEIIWKTNWGNILMSDYWHHPTEISLTLKALKDQNPARPILTVFQPHQYSRTYELLEDFKTCFYDTDKLIIPNIYESRDSKEDKQKIDTQKLIDNIKHHDKLNWEDFEKTLKEIKKWDKQNQYWIILLQGAWDIDNLRYKIKTS